MQDFKVQVYRTPAVKMLTLWCPAGFRDFRKKKGLKYSDSSLVSKENFSEILLSTGWALGQVT